MSSTARGRPRATASPSETLRRGGLALAVAVPFNAGLVFLAGVAGVAPNLMHVDYGRVSAFTAVGVAGATLTYLLLSRTTAAPDRTFTRLAAVLAALSMVPTALVIPGEPGGTVAGTVLLGAMHLPPAAASVVFLTGRHRR